jgi:hypothetical protein
MRHSKAIFYLDAYDREELSPSVRVRLDEHLERCEPCSVRAGKAASLAPFLAQMQANATPPGFEQAILAVRLRTLRAVRQESETAPGLLVAWLRTLGRVPVVAPVMLGALVLLVLLVPALRRSGTAVPGRAVADATRTAGTHDFMVVRWGRDVQIQWPHNGRSEHRVRKARDPVTVRVAGGQTVRGKVWKDPEARPVAGTVTYYLVD